MIRLLVFMFVSVSALFASDAESDILQRSVNFAIFAALSWYLFAGFIKNFFGKRREEIAKSFERAQDRVKLAKSLKEEAQKELEEAKAKAAEILETSKEEATLLVKKIKERKDEEIKILNRLKDENKLVMENRMIRSVVSQTMGEILDSDELLADQEAIVENMIKKVA